MFSNIDHKALEALLHGQGSANNLKTLLQNHELCSASIEPLINTVLDSFALVLSSMNSPNLPPQHGSSSQNLPSHVPQRSSKKRIYGAESLENYRDDSPDPLSDDGFAWRKYGQKPIKNSLHQRCYYRCTYAKEKNCNATKRVQKIKDNPPVYRTTYMGQHICKDLAVNDDTYGSEMIRFDHVMHESVTLQLVSIDHQENTIEDISIDHTMNQECDINDFFVDDDQFWAYDFPLSPGEIMLDPMFL